MKKQLDEVKRLQKIAGIKEADYGFNKPFHDPYSQLTGTGKPTSDSPMLRAAAKEILDNLAVTSTEEELTMMTAEEAVAAAKQARYEDPQATQIARLILRMVGSGM